MKPLIEAIVTGVVTLVTTVAEKLGSKSKPKLDQRLDRLESEKLADSMLERAKAMRDAEQARKRMKEDGK